MGDDSLNIQIGAREIYDEVVKLRDDVHSMGEAGAQSRADIDDHETRIRKLETWRYSLPVAVVSGLTAAAVTLAQIAGKA